MNKQLVYVFCMFQFSLFLTTRSQEWVNPSDKLVQTVYYQGMNSSQTQASKYTGQHGFISPLTLERITCSKSINIVKNLWVHPEIDEVITGKIKRDWRSILFRPRVLLPQLWNIAHEIIFRIANKMNGVQVTRYSASDSAQTLATHSLCVSKINIAQEGDLLNHERRMESLIQELPDADIIMMGVSRGAATTFEAAASYNAKDKDKLKSVKLIHLEGCFDSVEHTMKMRHPWLLRSNFSFNVIEKLASRFIAFKREGIAPLKMVADFPKHIPVAFISSKKDKEVPSECTKTLINALLNEGHPEIYYLELDRSSHIGYMCDDPEDKKNYQNFMHALFKKCGTPYIPAYAEAGKALVEQAKVTKVFTI